MYSGSGYRHEIQQIAPESQKKPITWNSSDNTDQVFCYPFMYTFFNYYLIYMSFTMKKN